MSTTDQFAKINQPKNDKTGFGTPFHDFSFSDKKRKRKAIAPEEYLLQIQDAEKKISLLEEKLLESELNLANERKKNLSVEQENKVCTRKYKKQRICLKQVIKTMQAFNTAFLDEDEILE